MSLQTTAIAAGIVAVLGAGVALAQPAPQGPPPQSGSYQGYQGGYQGPSPGQQGMHQGRHGHHHGVMSLIKEEVRAGRISQKEGALLEHKIRELHAERRAERAAREQGERGAQ